MATSRAQLEQQIKNLEKGGASNPADQYVKDLKNIDRSPASYESVNERAKELARYFPQTRRMTIYDLASSVSQGIAQNAQSARPTALGYGLGMGFNLFTKESQRRRDEADKMSREIALMARQEVERERANDNKIAEAGLDAQFKLQLQQLKEVGSGVFQGKGDLASALNYILRAEANPKLKETPEYKIALMVAARPRPQVVQTEQGSSVVMVPGLDVGSALSPPTSQSAVPDGYSDTGKRTTDGKRIFENNETGDLVKEQ